MREHSGGVERPKEGGDNKDHFEKRNLPRRHVKESEVAKNFSPPVKERRGDARGEEVVQYLNEWVQRSPNGGRTGNVSHSNRR